MSQQAIVEGNNHFSAKISLSAAKTNIPDTRTQDLAIVGQFHKFQHTGKSQDFIPMGHDQMSVVIQTLTDRTQKYAV